MDRVPRSKPVHVGTLVLPFCADMEDCMAMTADGKRLVVYDASELLFYCMDALGYYNDDTGFGPAYKTFVAAQPSTPSRFCCTKHDTMVVLAEHKRGMWILDLWGKEVQAHDTGDVADALAATDSDTIVLAFKDHVEVLSYDTGAVLHAFPLVGMSEMDLVVALNPLSTGAVWATQTGQSVLYSPDGYPSIVLGKEVLSFASAAVVLPNGDVLVVDWFASLSFIFSGGDGNLLHTLRPRAGAKYPFAVVAGGSRCYIMFRDSFVVHVLE
jgi:hypothetical protein